MRAWRATPAPVVKVIAYDTSCHCEERSDLSLRGAERRGNPHPIAPLSGDCVVSLALTAGRARSPEAHMRSPCGKTVATPKTIATQRADVAYRMVTVM